MKRRFKMKKILVAVFALSLVPAIAFGAANVDNGQAQGQLGGGIAVPTATVAGQAGLQGQAGKGSADAGDIAFDNQYQTQNDSGVAVDPNGTGSMWNGTQTQTGGGITAGGTYTYAGVQGQLGADAAVNDGAGTAGIAGSTYAGATAVGVVAVGATAVGATGVQTFEGAYFSANSNANGFSNQYGAQSAFTEAGAGAAIIGGAVAGADVKQSGGTLVTNDGTGHIMAGNGTAAGNANAGASAVGLATAGAEAGATQVHGYEQSMASGSASQYATGVVGTSVHAIN